VPGQLEWYHPGLHGVVAGETEICSLSAGLLYRGYCIHDLAENSTFLEVAHLLLYESLPGTEQLADFNALLCEGTSLPDLVTGLLEQLPLHMEPVDVLRSGIALLAHDDLQCVDGSDGEGIGKAVTIVARLPMLVAAWHRVREGWPPFEWSPAESYAANLFRALVNRSPSRVEEDSLNAALIVSAEQEFNPATFAARIVGSTNGDLYCAVLAGLAVHGGRRHSGDYESILTLMRSAPEAHPQLLSDESIAIPGFGHPVFSDCDPRAAILEHTAAVLADKKGADSLEASAEEWEHRVWESRRLPVNLDWPLARVLHYLGMRTDLHLPVFLCARAVGWCAHALEQAASGTVIRPRARYRGVESLDYEPLERRGG
jgi:citrate synthase